MPRIISEIFVAYGRGSALQRFINRGAKLDCEANPRRNERSHSSTSCVCRGTPGHLPSPVRRFGGRVCHGAARTFPWARPWPIVSGIGRNQVRYKATKDADPTHLYQKVLVAIDPVRYLNNGKPASLA